MDMRKLMTKPNRGVVEVLRRELETMHIALLGLFHSNGYRWGIRNVTWKWGDGRGLWKIEMWGAGFLESIKIGGGGRSGIIGIWRLGCPNRTEYVAGFTGESRSLNSDPLSFWSTLIL